MKSANIHMTIALLTRQGYEVFRPCYPAGFDLLVKKSEHIKYTRVLVLTVKSPKPIVTLATTRRGERAVREFDLLFCIHLESLSCWQIPEHDVPEKESLYLSVKYDPYKVQSFIPKDIDKPEPKRYKEVQKEVQRDIENLEKMQADRETTYDDIDDLLS